jgi:transcription elongation factor GreA
VKTGASEEYHLVFGDASEFDEGHVSMASPIGKALVGKGVGDVTMLRLPSITRQLEIVELTTIHDAATNGKK